MPSNIPSEPQGASQGEGVPSGGGAMDADGDGLPDAAWVKAQRGQVNAAGVGLQFGLSIVLFALVGNWADGRFGTGPWLLLLGVALGFAGGTISLLKKFK